ncbi:MAG: methyl-accepting chemotaxis protein [Longimicrobiales bacterium]
MPLQYFDRIQGRLLAALGALIIGALAMWWLGIATLDEFADDVAMRIEQVHGRAQLGNRLVITVMDQIAAGEHYVLAPSVVLADQFERLGRTVHELGAEYSGLQGLSTEEQVGLARIEALHSRLEVEMSLAHAYSDLGEAGAAIAQVESADSVLERLRMLVRDQSTREVNRTAAAVAEVRQAVVQRQPLMLIALALTIVLGSVLVWGTLRMINQPLDRLVVAARQLGEGDLRVQVNGRMPSELQSLASAFSRMAGRLRTIVGETVTTSDQIAASASQLSAISEEVAASAGEVSTAMGSITAGADEQASGIQSADAALADIRRRAEEVSGTIAELRRLSEQIQRLAGAKRDALGGAMAVLLEVREAVQDSGDEVERLQESSEEIHEFVETIQTVARQTNLLALNAAIEAARAGDHGRGFAVVADEVRKLADDSARAAKKVGGAVEHIRKQIETVAGSMRAGTSKVAGVEEVSRDVDVAFAEIMTAIAAVSEGAARVETAAAENRDAVDAVGKAVRGVGATAESHAASAEQVSAAAEEQSATTQELSAASSELLQAAERLKQLVAEFEV